MAGFDYIALVVCGLLSCTGLFWGFFRVSTAILTLVLPPVLLAFLIPHIHRFVPPDFIIPPPLSASILSASAAILLLLLLRYLRKLVIAGLGEWVQQGIDRLFGLFLGLFFSLMILWSVLFMLLCPLNGLTFAETPTGRTSMHFYEKHVPLFIRHAHSYPFVASSLGEFSALIPFTWTEKAAYYCTLFHNVKTKSQQPISESYDDPAIE